MSIDQNYISIKHYKTFFVRQTYDMDICVLNVRE